MKKCIRAIIAVVALALASASAYAAGLDTRIYSDNHSYSTASQTQISNLKIAMRPSASIDNSQIEIYLYAIAPTATASDGLADANAFDIGRISVKCPDSIPGAFEFGEPEIYPAEIAHINFSGRDYHKIVCPYTGSGDVRVADFGFNNDNYLQISNLINPQNDPTLPNSQLIYSPIWVTFTRAAVAQLTITSGRSVEVLAVIVPQISLTLEGLPGGGSYCGITNKNTTSGREANFGEVNNTYFSDVAQRLTVTTNMAHGYVVTARQDDQMHLQDRETPVVCQGQGRDNDACIPDATVADISPTTTKGWGDRGSRGLAFTLENDFGGDNVFSYREGYRIFADEQNGDEAVAILTSADGRRGVDFVCYRLVPTDDNIVGNYANNITYTLTAKF